MNLYFLPISQIQPSQREAVKKVLSDKSQEKPTVFRSQLVLSLAKNLTSYQTFPPVEPTVNGTLNVIYQNLCSNHGTELTKSVLGLISIPRHGLTETAIMDILSGHEKLLDDVFQYHKPRNGFKQAFTSELTFVEANKEFADFPS